MGNDGIDMSVADPSRAYLPRRTAHFLLNSLWAKWAAVSAFHGAALVSMYLTEVDLLGWTLFLLTWVLVNCFWLALLRKPAVAAALSFVLIILLILFSRFKFAIIWMTLDFLDLLTIDSGTIAFLLGVFPDLRVIVAVAGALALLVLMLLWRLDPFRVRLRSAAAGGAVCLAGIVSLSLAMPIQNWEPFQGVNHVSNFTRSAAASFFELMRQGWIELDQTPAPELLLQKIAVQSPCQPAGQRPHIILVLDEGSFDITAIPGVRTPPDYQRHFRSFDGKLRSLLVEGSGGPTWYTEYNVLTGLSVRSYGRLKYYVTRVAAGRVERGLPRALRRCGYRTFSLYPAPGAFLDARRFQTTTGIEHFLDSQDLRMGDVEPDSFFYDWAARLIARERGQAPLFLFVYTVANHFPWTTSYLPEMTPNWRALGNAADVDEYIRRQMMSARDYADFRARLQREFPGEPFLIVRFGDHQPALAARLVDPSLDEVAIAQRVMAYDPRYYTTYYAIDAINFAPGDLSSALERLEASYLPLVVQEAAGLPLEPSFAKQKKILQRCEGLFYACANGAEARRFNRLLLDAGLLKGF